MILQCKCEKCGITCASQYLSFEFCESPWVVVHCAEQGNLN